MIEFPQFIYGEIISHDTCDRIIDWFDNCDRVVEGRCGDQAVIRPEVKESSDVSMLLNPDLHEEYWSKLGTVCDNYLINYPLADAQQQQWRDLQGPNVQKYEPGQGFKIYHYENNGTAGAINRHLVYMTYLNDVPDGGTHFLFQDFECPAIKGLTIIWPAPWMYTHKSIISHTSTKYIVTGWYEYYGKESQK